MEPLRYQHSVEPSSIHFLILLYVNPLKSKKSHMHKLKEDGAHRPLFDVSTKQQST